MMQQTADATTKPMDTVTAFVVIMVTITEVFITVAPYFGMALTIADPTLAAQQQAMMQTVFIAIISFLTGYNVATRKKDDVIGLQAATAAAVQAEKTVPTPGGITP